MLGQAADYIRKLQGLMQQIMDTGAISNLPTQQQFNLRLLLPKPEQVRTRVRQRLSCCAGTTGVSACPSSVRACTCIGPCAEARLCVQAPVQPAAAAYNPFATSAAPGMRHGMPHSMPPFSMPSMPGQPGMDQMDPTLINQFSMLHLPYMLAAMQAHAAGAGVRPAYLLSDKEQCTSALVIPLAELVLAGQSCSLQVLSPSTHLPASQCQDC